MEKHNVRQPFMGKLGASVVATVCGGILTFGVLAALNAPQRNDARSAQRDNAQQHYIDTLRGEIDELRGLIGQDEVYLERISGRIDNLETKHDQQQEATQRDISRLDDHDKGVISYLTEEQRRK